MQESPAGHLADDAVLETDFVVVFDGRRRSVARLEELLRLRSSGRNVVRRCRRRRPLQVDVLRRPDRRKAAPFSDDAGSRLRCHG